MNETASPLESGVARSKLIGGYVVTAPIVFSAVVWSAVTGPPSSDIGFWVFFTTVVGLVLASVGTFGLLYKDIALIRDAEIRWNPSRTLYLVAPVAAGVITYLIAIYHFESANPSGDAVYGYAAVLWVTTAIYSYQRRRFSSDSLAPYENG